MLTDLSIRNVVLIDQLDLAWAKGLSVLTGETGAGKSMMLDSLHLALGQRADTGLIRQGEKQAQVTASFDLANDHPVWQILTEAGIEAESPLVLRRALHQDGKSKAFINDQAVSVALLKQIGQELVEIQGQFEQQGLMNAASHLTILDRFGGHEKLTSSVADCFETWKTARQERLAHEESLAKLKSEQDYIQASLNELDDLAPMEGEETRLVEKRSLLQNLEKIRDVVGEAMSALEDEQGSMAQLNRAIRALERHQDKIGKALDPVLEQLNNAYFQIENATQELHSYTSRDFDDQESLESIEDRLFALRGIARKHNVAVDELPALHERFQTALHAISHDETLQEKFLKAEEDALNSYHDAAMNLRKARAKTAKILDKKINAELPDLRLEKAVFATMLEEKPKGEPTPSGLDHVEFMIATNPGMPPGPLARIASGGELSRFLLALKVVLADADPIATMIFDEVDAGLGGAVASAVGEKLSRLGKASQIIVITHSPQVAALADQHLLVEKTATKNKTTTSIKILNKKEREEEVARMLSGTETSDEARAAAQKLMKSA